MTFTASEISKHFTCTEHAGVIVVTFQRRQLTDEDNLEQLGESLFDLIERDRQARIVLDLSQLDFVTSAVLGKFISLHRRLRRHGGDLVLCSLQPAVRETMYTSRLLDYFQTVDSLDDATALLTA